MDTGYPANDVTHFGELESLCGGALPFAPTVNYIFITFSFLTAATQARQSLDAAASSRVCK